MTFGGSMDFWTAIQALILGVVEGLTEFLPISSTGHQIIVADLLDFGGERAMAFNIIIQLGAILAVVWEFRPKIFDIGLFRKMANFGGLFEERYSAEALEKILIDMLGRTSEIKDALAKDPGVIHTNNTPMLRARVVAVKGVPSEKVKASPEREGRNPATGEKMTVAASKKLTFAPAKALKDALNK